MVEEVRVKAWELRNALATIGFRRTCTVIGVRFADAWFDWRHGLDTVTRVPLENLPFEHESKPFGGEYQPTGLPAFRSLLRAVTLPRDVGFVDYGCGKGRVVLLAGEAGFRRALGVEFSPELCDIARRNISRFREGRPGLPPMEIVEADASRYEPPADVSIFYFYCPFDENLTRSAVDRIFDSLRRNPREAWVIYNLPRHRSVVDGRPGLVLEQEIIVGGYECNVYHYRPPA